MTRPALKDGAPLAFVVGDRGKRVDATAHLVIRVVKRGDNWWARAFDFKSNRMVFQQLLARGNVPVAEDWG